jgi:hypothetical protein
VATDEHGYTQIRKETNHVESSASDAALQRPGDNCTQGKLSMKDLLIPVHCKALIVIRCALDRAPGSTKVLGLDVK